jgi:hypothetical protein
MFLPSPMKWIALASAAFTSVVGIGWMVRRSYSSMQLEGNRVLLKQLYTGRQVVRSIDDIEMLTAIVMSSGELSNAIANKMLGRFRGFDVRFRDGQTPIRVTRADPAERSGTGSRAGRSSAPILAVGAVLVADPRTAASLSWR